MIDRCPFCRTKDSQMRGGPEVFWRECLNPDCLATGPIGETKEEATERWNLRPGAKFTGWEKKT